MTAATLIGVPAGDVPDSVAALADYFERVRPELQLTPPARAAYGFIVLPPMPGWVQLLTPARPGWATLASLGVATLPPWARRMYGLPAFGVTEPAATAAVLARRVLAEAASAPDDDLIRDCLGELANVVAGQAKTMLADTPFQLVLATPSVLSRAGLGVGSRPGTDGLVVVFDSDAGSFALQVCLDRCTSSAEQQELDR